MIRLKKGKGVFQSFLVGGFSMMFFFFPPTANAKCVVITLADVPYGGENYYIFIL